MTKISMDLRETNLPDRQVYKHEFWKRAIKFNNPKREVARKKKS